jgi:regulator of sigma E protease
MPKTKGLLNKYFRLFLWVIFFAVVVYLILRNIGVFGNVLKVIIGFGVVIVIHEFGHFIFAKLTGIKVEAFSIGFPPILAGILRTENGFRFRILPKFFPKEDDESGDGLLSFTIGRKGKAGETEYRIGLIPFGGYNKLLGQEDTKAVESSDDPHSYANKPVGTRMAVIAAGVTFNAISAILIFMIIFFIGINLTPAVVGGVVPNSPASRAGLKAGDEIIEIAGEKDNLDFRNIVIGALLSGSDEEVALKVRHEDGSIEDFAVVAERIPTARGEMRAFGVLSPQSLTVASVSDPNALFENTGLLPGDHIKSVNGRDVKTFWELEEIVQNALVSEVKVLSERAERFGESKLIASKIGLELSFANSYTIESESELHHIYSIVPRLRIEGVVTKLPSIKDRLVSLLSKISTRESVVDTSPKLQSGDVVLQIGDVENPTYLEIREVVTEYEDKELPIMVLRVDANDVEEIFTVTTVPYRIPDSNRVVIGIRVALDAEHAVVAKTISVEDGPARLAIPRGAVITAVDGAEVSNFYDVIREIRRNAGERITIDYRLGERTGDGVTLDAGDVEEFITVKSGFAEFVPFEFLERLYKASGPIDAIVIGFKKTFIIIAQTYLSVKRLLEGLVGQKELSGPVGIIAMSYQIAAKQPLIDYVYFLGVISVLLAVFNLLPIPPFDGGWLVLLLVEKVKGSALSERVQESIAYAGVVFIVALFLYLTFNDIVNMLFR